MNLRTKYAVITISVVIIVLIIVWFMTSRKAVKNTGELNAPMPKFNPAQNEQIQEVKAGYVPERAGQKNIIKHNEEVLPYPQISNNYSPLETDIMKADGMSCYPKDTITPKELMPVDDSNNPNPWKDSNPDVGNQLGDRNLLEAGHHNGIDTVGGTLKNPNLQLRSDPVIPKTVVGPWAQSSYEPDTNRRQLEIGGDY